MKIILYILFFFLSFQSLAEVSIEPTREQWKYKLNHSTDEDERLEAAIEIAHDYIFYGQNEWDSVLVYLEIAELHPDLSHTQKLKIWQEYIYYYQFQNPVKGYEYLDLSLIHI